jgi:hypothetical protein
MGNIGQFKIYWAIFLSVYLHQKTDASQRGIVTFKLEADILGFFSISQIYTYPELKTLISLQLLLIRDLYLQSTCICVLNGFCIY